MFISEQVHNFAIWVCQMDPASNLRFDVGNQSTYLLFLQLRHIIVVA